MQAAVALCTGLAVGAVVMATADARAVPPPPALPPLQQPARAEHHTGKAVDELLATPDLAAAKQFYGSLFGWTLRDTSYGQTTFSEALADGQAVAGLVTRPLAAGAQHRSAWLRLISTPDVATASAAATQRGQAAVRPAGHSAAWPSSCVC